MAAPTNAANVKKILANPEPSTHGIKELLARGYGRPVVFARVVLSC